MANDLKVRNEEVGYSLETLTLRSYLRYISLCRKEDGLLRHAHDIYLALFTELTITF